MYGGSGINASGQKLMYRDSSDRSSAWISMDSCDGNGFHIIPMDSMDSYDYHGLIRFHRNTMHSYDSYAFLSSD